ncbi:MAG: hypothetical protein QOE70_2112 [Chthoniobacter sp.]|jgi:hypothetical protein|nr:hypothetical protein [Chthoniobacter sp.]
MNALFITDDAAVEALLLLSGHPLPQPTPPFTKSIYYFRHEHQGQLYYCMVSHERGHADPADNGYVLIGLSASLFTPKEAVEWFLDAVRMTSFGPIENAVPDFTRN